ncbi:translation initiation factor IF-2-like [Vulpes lagopus]|uniref:translation initiation factor IF-2-like n=1 Tax=Vulpes lagopus TaxID=494514 RepID=UPI001BC9F886|nr:translation initiation factor IF-2-like [Vulpes lagopus]
MPTGPHWLCGKLTLTAHKADEATEKQRIRWARYPANSVSSINSTYNVTGGHPLGRCPTGGRGAACAARPGVHLKSRRPRKEAAARPTRSGPERPRAAPSGPAGPHPPGSRGPRPGGGGRGADCNTNLAIEGLHSLHVVGAEAPSPAAEEAAATALGGESEAGAAARPRGGAPAGAPAAATPGQARKGRHGRGRAPSGAARPRHGRWGGRSAGLGNTGAAGAGRPRAGEGPGRGAFSSPPRSVSARRPLAPSPALSTPSFFFPRQTPVSPPRRSGRRNQQRAAKTEEEALAAAAAASNMAAASRAAQLGDPRRRPARPLVTGPRGPERPRGNHRAGAGQSVAAGRSRSAPLHSARPGGSPRLAGTGASAAAAAAWGARARPGRPPRSVTPRRARVCPRSVTSRRSHVHAPAGSRRAGPFTRAAGAVCLSELAPRGGPEVHSDRKKSSYSFVDVVTTRPCIFPASRGNVGDKSLGSGWGQGDEASAPGSSQLRAGNARGTTSRGPGAQTMSAAA